MSGIILIAVLAAWFFISKFITSFLTTKIQAGAFKKVAQVLLFALILLVPVADEIVGGFQFRALCKTDAVAVYDKDKVYGKTVHLISADIIHYANKILPMYKQVWRYADHETNDEVLSYTDINSDGGWLSRWVNFNNVHEPYIFGGICGGNYREYFFQDLNVKNVNKN